MVLLLPARVTHPRAEDAVVLLLPARVTHPRAQTASSQHPSRGDHRLCSLDVVLAHLQAKKMEVLQLSHHPG